MWKRLTAIGVAAALAAGGVLAGCGGDDESDPKAEYIKMGDEICALGTFKIGTQSRKRFGDTQPSPAEQAEFARQVVVPTLQGGVLDKLRALTPPPGEQQQLTRIYDALQGGIDRLRANPSLLAEPNAGGAFTEANRLAQDYGFQQCGSG